MTRKNIEPSDSVMTHYNETMPSNHSHSMIDSASHTVMYKHFEKAGELYSSETEVLGAAIRLILASNGVVTNKAIILHLINQLESTSDIVQLDVLRKTLELVVGYTPDDCGF